MNILLFIVFSIPSMQTAAADFALKKLQPKIQTEAAIGKIRLKLFNKVQLENVYLEDRSQDTLLYVKKLQARLHPWNLLNNKLLFEQIVLEDFTAKVNRENPDKQFNFQFLIDAFAGEKKPKDDTPKKSLEISILNLRLKNGTLHYDILSADETPGQFNPEHIFVKDLNLRARLPSIDIEKLDADISTLSFWEHAGITVDDFEGKVRSKGKKIWSDKLNVTLNHSDIKVTKAVYNTETKEFELSAKSPQIDPKDVALFAPQLAHLDKPLRFETDIDGQLPYVSVQNLEADYGGDTHLKFKGLIKNYETYENTDIDLDISRLKVSQEDLLAFIRIGDAATELPEQLTALGALDLRLRAKGKLSRFNVTALLETAPGNVQATGIGSADKEFETYAFNGNVMTENLKLAQILGETAGVDNLSLNSEVKLLQAKNAPLHVSADGVIQSVDYKQYHYRNLFVNATYSGNTIEGAVRTDTEQDKLNLKANIIQGKTMDVNISGTIDKLMLEPFYKAEHWENANLVARIDGHFSGSNIDNMSGQMVIDSSSLYDENFIYNPGPIYLEAVADSLKEKKIRLYASFLEGEISGDYSFSTIGEEISSILHTHLPSVIAMEEKKKPIQEKNKFQFNFQLKNTEDLSYAFDLPFYNVEPATISGDVNLRDGELVALDALLPRLMFGKNEIRQTKVTVNMQKTAGIKADINSYLVQDDGYINAHLITRAANDSATNSVLFDIQNSVAQSNGTLQIDMGFRRMTPEQLMTDIFIRPATILFNKKNVHIQEATIHHTKDKIDIHNFGILDDGIRKFGIDGTASTNLQDSIRVFFKDTELTSILSAFNIQDINGLMNGGLIVQNALESPILHTENFQIENMTAYNDTIGTMRIESDFIAEQKGFDVNVYIQKDGITHSSVVGFVPSGEEKPIDLKIDLKELPLSWIQPFAESAFSELSGTMSSNIAVSGKLSQPIAEGWLGVHNGLMRVDYTNVTYTISDTIQVNRDNVGFNDLLITDNDGQTAKISLELKHSNFGKMAYNTNITLDNFLVLNNEDRTDLMAYGLLRLSGNIALNGSSEGISGEVELRNGNNSKVMIELPQTATASENHGVIYINTPQETDSFAFLRKKTDKELNTRLGSSMPINILATINLDPELNMGALLDPVSGNAVQISGTGEIRAIYNSKADPSVRLYGDYIAENGKAHLNLLQNLKKIDFNIKKGSVVTFMGDPLRTQFNITAYNRVKADLTTLSESFAQDQNVTSTRVPVNALLEIKGDMNKMDLYYDIELPEASEDVKQKVRSLIATEEQRIRQFAYLIASGNFYTSSGTPDMFFSANRFTNMATDFLSKGLDALFASALNDNWSISTNLETQDGDFENVRFGVDVSTKLFNDKLRLSTNLSYGDNTTMASQQAFMGEFDAEYDIYKWLMLRAYNRANQRYYKRAPYTQGVGIVVNKEARRLQDLFKFTFRRRKETKTEE